MGASILTGHWDERPINRVSIPATVNTRTYFSFPKWSDRLWAYTYYPSMGTGASFRRVETAGAQNWHYLHPLPMLTVNGAIRYLASTPLWRAEGLYLDKAQPSFSKG
jgi:hypothetical protein